MGTLFGVFWVKYWAKKESLWENGLSFGTVDGAWFLAQKTGRV
jgi:hypothetical protein